MDWSEYFKDAKLGEKKAFAKRCGIAPMHLHNIIAGRKRPSPKLAQTMRRESGNRLSLEVLRPEDWSEIWPDAAASLPQRRVA